jgi:polyhydroxyalkanoate synthesis regulator phasin
MVADNDLINRVRKAEEKYGWADYEMRGLEAQVKQLTKRIKELEDERK